eukprot:1419911-Rhodomonas_salina.1
MQAVSPAAPQLCVCRTPCARQCGRGCLISRHSTHTLLGTSKATINKKATASAMHTRTRSVIGLCTRVWSYASTRRNQVHATAFSVQFVPGLQAFAFDFAAQTDLAHVLIRSAVAGVD